VEGHRPRLVRRRETPQDLLRTSVTNIK